MRRRGALVLVSPYHLISHSASAAPSPLTCRGHLALPQREAHPGLLPPGVLTSILRTASSMAADVAAISLSTIAPSSSSRTSRLLGFSSWGTRHPGVRQGGWILPWLPHRAWGPDGQCSFPTCAPQWQALHLSPCSAQAGRRYGETGPRPHRPPPGPRSAARLTWPSWRMPCSGVRTRPGRACSRACCSCSCPMSSSARAPHSLQVSIRPGAGRGL